MQGFDPSQGADLRRHVREALARFGAVGQISLSGDIITLDSPNGRFTTAVGHYARDWDRLSLEERREAAIALARDLNHQRLAAVAAMPRESRVSPYLLTGLLLLVLVGLFVIYVLFGLAPTGGGSTAAGSASATVADYRHQGACEQSRTRVLRGGTLGPLDVDGWVVEISLLRPGDALEFARDPAFDVFVARSRGEPRLVWTGTKELVKLTSETSRLAFEERVYPARGRVQWREAVLTFSGRFVDRYFREAERGAFHQLADALATRLGAAYGAVYARCAHRQDAMVGSWIRGTDVPSATAALIFFMDLRSASSHLRGGDGRSDPLPDPTSPLVRFREAAKDLDRRELATLLADTGGMVAGTDQSTTVLFPFQDFSRASRASRQIARRLRATLPASTAR